MLISEREVQAALDHLVGQGKDCNRTTLMIAHRLSTIANVDRIFVLRRGELVESGTPAELLSLGGFRGVDVLMFGYRL